MAVTRAVTLAMAAAVTMAMATARSQNLHFWSGLPENNFDL